MILTYSDEDRDEVCGGMPYTKSVQGIGVQRQDRTTDTVFNNKSCGLHNANYDSTRVEGYNDEGSAARYFYCAKASSRDRDEGLDGLDQIRTGSMDAHTDGVMKLGSASLKGMPKEIQPKHNIHPTVKPTDLMQYLIRLVTPQGGIILDPFNGSGSTGKAAMYENYDRDSAYQYIGIELTPKYLPIADARIKYIENMPKQFKLF